MIGIYTGADPVANKVIQTGDVIDGLTVVSVDNANAPSINDKGQIAIGVWLAGDDGYHYAVYRADPSNHPPVLAAIGNKAVAELSTLSFTATASDPDAGDSLTFSLNAGAPAGAAISSAGAFSWTPTEAQGPGTYAVGIRVSDNGTPVESDSEVISIQVSEVNRVPVLAPIGNKTLKQGSTLTFTASASDSDLPKNTLTFSLVAGAPAGATINSSHWSIQLETVKQAGTRQLPDHDSSDGQRLASALRFRVTHRHCDEEGWQALSHRGPSSLRKTPHATGARNMLTRRSFLGAGAASGAALLGGGFSFSLLRSPRPPRQMASGSNARFRNCRR